MDREYCLCEEEYVQNHDNLFENICLYGEWVQIRTRGQLEVFKQTDIAPYEVKKVTGYTFRQKKAITKTITVFE